MLDKKLKINKYKIVNDNIKRNISFIVISDLHLCDSFNNKKLNTIKNKIIKLKPNYLFVAGDIIDSTNFLYTNIKLKDFYINWFKEISKLVPIFIVLGNHDMLYINKKQKGIKKYKEDIKNDFFDKLADINNIYVSNKDIYYEDDNITLNMLQMPLKYYHKNYFKESKLKKELLKLNNTNKNKFNILLTHCPIFFDNIDIKKINSKYDLIISGHMHGGAIPFDLDKIIPGNRGLVAPSKKLFPKNARGLCKLDNNYLLVSKGITKIQECSNLEIFNHLFCMDMDYVIINNIKNL